METTTSADTETYFYVRTKKSSDRLLAAMQAHHDFTLPAPPPKPKPIQITEAPAVSEPITIYVLPIRDALPTIEGIKRVVCRHYGVTHSDMISNRRQAKIVWPRQIAMYLCRELTSLSFPRIGRKFGGRDHTTALHAANKVGAMIAADPVLRSQVDELRAQFQC